MYYCSNCSKNGLKYIKTDWGLSPFRDVFECKECGFNPSYEYSEMYITIDKEAYLKKDGVLVAPVKRGWAVRLLDKIKGGIENGKDKGSI